MAEEVGGFAVARIEGEGGAEDALGIGEIALLEVALAEEDERAAEIGVKPNGALEVGNGEIPMLAAGVSVAEAIPGHGVAGIEANLFLKVANGTVEIAVRDGDFTEEEVSAENVGIKRQRLGGFGGGLVLEFLLEHHLGGGGVGGGGIGF